MDYSLRLLISCFALVISSSTILADTSLNALAKNIVFLASFDNGADADFAKGDAKIYTLESLNREKMTAGITTDKVKITATGGRFGGALQFHDNTEEVIAFKGDKNTGYASGEFGMTISFWMLVDPSTDLKPGYVDPLQITDKKWNDAALWVDFTKDNPRAFRFGVMSDYKHWNPDDTKFDDIPAAELPMIPANQPKFTNKQWSHVALVIAKANSNEQGKGQLFIDGKLQGELDRPLKFTWDEDKVYIMLGIQYIGFLDELTIINRAITEKETLAIRQSESSLLSIVKKR